MQTTVLEFKQEYINGKPVDFVKIGPRGEALQQVQTWRRVAKMMPRPDKKMSPLAETHQKAMWAIIEPQYEAWRAGAEMPESGTPLAAWSGVSAEQAAILRKMGIVSVEDVAAMGDGATGKLPWPGARNLPKMAKAYLDGESKAELARRNAEMEERMKAMEEMLAERMGEQPAKRGPGRPRKTEAA